MRTVAMTLGAFASSACVSLQANSDDLNSNLKRYVGQSAEQVVAQLGAPEVKGAVGDRTAWAYTSRTQLDLAPTATTLRTTGTHLGQSPVALLISDAGDFMAATGCELRLVMTANGKEVERTQWSGSMGVCLRYLKDLERVQGRANRTS